MALHNLPTAYQSQFRSIDPSNRTFRRKIVVIMSKPATRNRRSFSAASMPQFITYVPEEHDPVNEIALAPPETATDASAVSSGYLLVAIEGPYVGQTFHLRQLPARFGRVQDAAICLEQDLRVSRHHAELYMQGNAIYLRDLGSSHGTRLNNRTIDDKRISPEDYIGIGHSTFVLKKR